MWPLRGSGLGNLIFPLSQSGASDYRAVILALHDVIIALLLAMEGRQGGGSDQRDIRAISILQPTTNNVTSSRHLHSSSPLLDEAELSSPFYPRLGLAVMLVME